MLGKFISSAALPVPRVCTALSLVNFLLFQGSENPHKQIQKSILHFLGSLGGHVNAGLVERGSAAVYAQRAVAWDSADHLMLDLPFQDLKPTICLGQWDRVGSVVFSNL